jgi:hypothetical protein
MFVGFFVFVIGFMLFFLSGVKKEDDGTVQDDNDSDRDSVIWDQFGGSRRRKHHRHSKRSRRVKH